MLAYRCLQMKWCAAVTVVAIPSQKALLMCPYVSSGKFSVLAPSCSCALLHNLQLTSDRCLIFASHLATGVIPAITIISRLLCLQRTRGSFRYFPKNALLSCCRNMNSAVHVPYAGWLILPCSALARTRGSKNFLSSIQVFCCKTFTMLWYDSSYRWLMIDFITWNSNLVPLLEGLCTSNPCRSEFSVLLDTIPHIVACVCSPLCHHLYSIFCISSPECAHLSPSTCKLIFMFLHLILCCPSPCCIPHTIIKCRVSILISYFPCLAAWFFPHEDCSIRPLAPLFAYIRIWNSFIRQNVGSLNRWFSSFTLTKTVAVSAAILFCSISMVAARISASGAPTNVAFPPSPIHLLTAFNNDWLSHKLIAGTLVTWAIYTQGQLLLWSSLIITGVVPGYK